MDRPLEKDIELFMDDPRRGACNFDEDSSFSDSDILCRAQNCREIQDGEDNERIKSEKIYLDDVAISVFSEEEISKHKYMIGLHNSEIMSKPSAYIDVKKPYQVPSSGFIDT